MTVTMEQMDARFAELRQEMLGLFAPASVKGEVARLNGWRRKMMADGSFGRVFNGPQWLDRVAIRDGAVDADKLAARITLSSMFATAEEPANRVQLSGAGLEAYGTVGGVPNQRTLLISNAGKFEVGTGLEKMSYDPATGTWVVPNAFAGTITIADVSGGQLGGTYHTSQFANSLPRIEFSTQGIRAWNSGGVNTFDLAAATGNITITGTFLLQSAASGSRVDIRNTGIRWYNGATIRAQILNDGSGFLGSTNGLPSNAAVSWGTDGQAIINATDITTGFMNGQRLQAGTVQDSAVASLSANKITSGTGLINNLTVLSTLTLGFGGKIVDNDGSFWDQQGIVLNSPSAVGGDNIEFRMQNARKGSVGVTASGLFLYGPNSLYYVGLFNDVGVLGASDSSQFQARTEQLWAVTGGGVNSFLSIRRANNEVGRWLGVGDIQARRIYPGSVTGTLQANAYLSSDGTNLDFRLPGTNGAQQIRVLNSLGGQVFGIDSLGRMGLPGNNTAALGAYLGKVAVNWNGMNGFVPVYA